MGLLGGKYDTESRLPQDDVRGARHDWMHAGSEFPDGRPNPTWIDAIRAVRDILTSDGRTLAQGAIAWLWAFSDATIPIPGFKGMSQAEENARALDFGPLTAGQLKEIERTLGTPADVSS